MFSNYLPISLDYAKRFHLFEAPKKRAAVSPHCYVSSPPILDLVLWALWWHISCSLLVNLSHHTDESWKGWNIWNVVRDFITFFSFVRLCRKFNTLFVFIVSIIRLSCIPHKALSRPWIKRACALKKGLPRLTSSKVVFRSFLATLK